MSVSVDAILRGIVVLTILRERNDEHITQAALCNKQGDKWTGLLHEQWQRFKLYDQGFHYPCSGAPHVANAATLMGELGLMWPPGTRDNKNDRYGLTPIGACLADFLLKEGVLRVRGRGGVETEEVLARQWVEVAVQAAQAFMVLEDEIVDNEGKSQPLRVDGLYVEETVNWLFDRFARDLKWAAQLKAT